jgi:hypothetical protein
MYSKNVLLAKQARKSVCFVLLWSSYLGINFVLVLAVVYKQAVLKNCLIQNRPQKVYFSKFTTILWIPKLRTAKFTTLSRYQFHRHFCIDEMLVKLTQGVRFPKTTCRDSKLTVNSERRLNVVQNFSFKNNFNGIPDLDHKCLGQVLLEGLEVDLESSSVWKYQFP